MDVDAAGENLYFTGWDETADIRVIDVATEEHS